MAHGSLRAHRRAEELGDPDAGRAATPDRERPQHREQVEAAADQQDDRRCEQRVLEELQGRDGVRRGRVRGRVPVTPSDLEREPDEERGGDEPEEPPGRKPSEAVPHADDHRCDDDGEHREVREIRVDARACEVRGHTRLELCVQEEKRYRRRDDERARCDRHADAHGAPTVPLASDATSSRTPLGDGSRHLFLGCARLPRDGGGCPPVRLDHGLRALHDRHHGGRVLPEPARSHRRGGGREVRLPLRRAGGVGPSPRPLPGGAAGEAHRRRAGCARAVHPRPALGRALRSRRAGAAARDRGRHPDRAGARRPLRALRCTSAAGTTSGPPSSCGAWCCA